LKQVQDFGWEASLKGATRKTENNLEMDIMESVL